MNKTAWFLVGHDDYEGYDFPVAIFDSKPYAAQVFKELSHRGVSLKHIQRIMRKDDDYYTFKLKKGESAYFSFQLIEIELKKGRRR